MCIHVFMYGSHLLIAMEYVASEHGHDPCTLGSTDVHDIVDQGSYGPLTPGDVLPAKRKSFLLFLCLLNVAPGKKGPPTFVSKCHSRRDLIATLSNLSFFFLLQGSFPCREHQLLFCLLNLSDSTAPHFSP